jgi:shikimate kinase
MARGKAIAYGAATIVNAIAIGRGAAFSVDLWTKAEVELTDEPGIIEGKIRSDPEESDSLMKEATRLVLERFGLAKRYGARVETDSNIPIARGLKSSSVAANAVVLATLDALGESLDDLSVVKLGVDASLKAGVTITGAFDDACASYFGGIVVTDNLNRRVIKRLEVEGDNQVLFHVPKAKVYTSELDPEKLKPFRPCIEAAYEEVLQGNIWKAMTLNGLLHSFALGYDPSLAVTAMRKGAVAAGLTGKGPAVAAVVPIDKVDDVAEAWSESEGDILRARLNRVKAHVIAST